MEESIRVEIWGTRGSAPAPAADRMAYGGNTCCVSARYEGGIAIFDGGTGLIPLGKKLANDRLRKPVHLFITHLHLDHIIGLPSFALFFDSNATIHIYGESRDGKDFQEMLEGFSGPPWWPVTFDDFPARVCWHNVSQGQELHLREHVEVSVMRSCHPNQCVMYRLAVNGKRMVYGLDCEPVDDIWYAYRSFARDCELLLFDAAYTDQEYPDVAGYGHGTWQQGIRMARECGAARTLLTHHSWERTDQELSRLDAWLRQQAPGVEVAKEGAVFCL